jgi:hypothetical protein
MHMAHKLAREAGGSRKHEHQVCMQSETFQRDLNTPTSDLAVGLEHLGLRHRTDARTARRRLKTVQVKSSPQRLCFPRKVGVDGVLLEDLLVDVA